MDFVDGIIVPIYDGKKYPTVDDIPKYDGQHNPFMFQSPPTSHQYHLVMTNIAMEKHHV